MFRRLLNTLIQQTFDLQPFYIGTSHPFHAPELEHLGWLSSVAPCFPVKADSITVINEPQVFYETLLQRSTNAKYRITLASLYLGTGELEQGFIKTIADNERFRSGELRVSVLLDYMRGSRYDTNSRTMLLPLLRILDSNCEICLYHTPFLRGLKKRITPPRFNEIYGLQHMKLYIFDDYLIISGANLSTDYFTNRQDRYIVIKDKKLADFYDGLVSKVQKFSLRMDEYDNVSLNNDWDMLPYKSSKYQFANKAGDLVSNYMLDSKCETRHAERSSENGATYNAILRFYMGFSLTKIDTWIFPLVQMGQLGVEQDSIVTERLLAQAPGGTKLFMATGYFNLTSQYTTTLINDSVAECNVLMAHPDANGFQGAKGPAGGIPAAYSLIAYNFQQKLRKENQEMRVHLQEYRRDGWTYHAKGLWYYPVGSTKPCLTLIGSPNFGERSVKKDLETQIAIVTENPELSDKLHKECTFLFEQGLPADVNRHVPKWVYAIVFMFKEFF